MSSCTELVIASKPKIEEVVINLATEVTARYLKRVFLYGGLAGYVLASLVYTFVCWLQ